jgi:hypothetical protein
MSKHSKGGSKGKGSNVNWFKEQDEKRLAAGNKVKAVKPANDYRQADDAPILRVQMNSKNEEKHFEESLAFAQRVSDPESTEVMTVHLNMDDELVFNMVQDESFDRLWKEGKLMLLVSFPRNWKTMAIEAVDEEDDDDTPDLESDTDRFDYLYESGMAVYEK